MTDTTDLRIRWEPAPYTSPTYAQIADVSDLGRLYVTRDHKGARTFTGKINGKPVAFGNNLDECMRDTAKAARAMLAAKGEPAA